MKRCPILIILGMFIFGHKQLDIKWPFIIPTHSVSASAVPGENNQRNVSWNEQKYVKKSIPNSIDCDLKKDWQVLIIFGANIFDTTCYQKIVLVLPHQMSVSALPTKTLTGELDYKCNISLVLFPQVVQKQTMGAVENWTVIWSAVVSEILTFPYLTSGVDRLLHLPSAEAVSAWPNAHPRMWPEGYR